MWAVREHQTSEESLQHEWQAPNKTNLKENKKAKKRGNRSKSEYGGEKSLKILRDELLHSWHNFRVQRSKKKQPKNKKEGLGITNVLAEIKNSVEGLGDKVSEISQEVEQKDKRRKIKEKW